MSKGDLLLRGKVRLRCDEFADALRNAGVREGETVHVQSKLYTVGPVDSGDDREAILEFYLSGFREVLGPGGTLTVCTAFEDYGRYAVPFVWEESPSRLGVFSEYVRTRPGAVRSMHPIVSVTALGAKAREICGGPHFEGFGYESPWGRLQRMNAKFMALGLGFRDSMTFAHYIERLYGVPYQYTKIYRTPVFSAGREVAGPFTMSVRYLDFGIGGNLTLFEERLLSEGKARQVPVGRSFLQITTAEEAVEVGMRLLTENRYAFLLNPPRFREGEIPADGPTGPEKQVYYGPQ
jgi:aminoglycoside N3'-acetyltransferase